MEFGVYRLGFGVWGLGVRVGGLEVRVERLRFGVWGLGFGVGSLGLMGDLHGPCSIPPTQMTRSADPEGSEFRVSGLGLRV